MAQTEALSPPVIEGVISDCARAVAVSGVVAGATVRIFANGTEVVGTAAPYLGWWHITTRPLVAGEVIAAVQEVGGNESFPSRRPVTVQYLTQAADPMSIPEISQPV